LWYNIVITMKNLYYIWTVVLIILTCNCTGIHKTLAPSSSSATDFPAKNWKYYSKAEDAGFNSKKLLKAKEQLALLDTTGLLVVVGGKILLEYGNVSEVSYVASIRKSILAIMYGKYVANNTIDLELVVPIEPP
jgi:hypothetical protein